MIETILGVHGDTYNILPLERQAQLLRELPIGSYILLDNIGEVDREYRIVGYELVSDIDGKEWINLQLDNTITDGSEDDSPIIHPGFAIKSKRRIRNEKLKQLGV